MKTARESEERQELLELASARGLELSEGRAAPRGRVRPRRRAAPQAGAGVEASGARAGRDRRLAGCGEDDPPAAGIRLGRGRDDPRLADGGRARRLQPGRRLLRPRAIIDQRAPYRLRRPARRAPVQRHSALPRRPDRAERRGRQGAGYLPAQAGPRRPLHRQVQVRYTIVDGRSRSGASWTRSAPDGRRSPVGPLGARSARARPGGCRAAARPRARGAPRRASRARSADRRGPPSSSSATIVRYAVEVWVSSPERMFSASTHAHLHRGAPGRVDRRLHGHE